MPKQHVGSTRYMYPIPHLVLPMLRVLLGLPSQPSRDAALLLRGMHPAPRVVSAENIPPETPFVLTMNHYDRQGLGAWWGVSVILDAVAARRVCEPRDIHFAMAREWWYPYGFGRLVKQPLTRWFFAQVAQTYGIIRLPPIIGNNEFKGEGTVEVRHAIELTRGEHPQLVGLSPEGRTGENLALCKPPEGAGLFVLMLTHDRIPCLPVGIYEDEGVLTVGFGAPFKLYAPRSLKRAERDAQAARQFMVQIGRVLPERMWGVFHDEIASGLGR